MKPEDTSMPTKVALYARVSSEEQAHSGTIENQLQFLRRYCELHGHNIVTEYTDPGVSGSLSLNQRASGQQLLRDAEARKFTMVLVYRLDRLSRHTLHLLQVVDFLDDLGIGLKSATEEFNTGTPTGKLVLTILGSIATLERETIIERSWLGRVRVAQQGRVPGGTAPLGYTFQNGTIVVVAVEANIVRRVFDAYTRDRLGTEAIANRLNAAGIRPTQWLRGKASNGYKGKPSRGIWTAPRVADILRNPAYKGDYHYGSLAVLCPSIVTPGQWEAVQKQREHNALMAGRNTKHRVYLLKGLIRCRLCGRRYVGGRSSTKASGYSCPNHRPAVNCDGPRVAAVPLEEAIWREVASFASDPGPVLEEVTKKVQQDIENREPVETEIESAHRRLLELDSERQRLLTLYRKGVINEEDVESQLKQLEREKEGLTAMREDLTGRLVALQESEARLTTAEMVLHELRDKVAQAGEKAKAELIQGLVKEVVVSPGPRIEVTYCFGKPSAIGSASWGR